MDGCIPEMEAWLTELASAAHVAGGGGSRKSRVKDMFKRLKVEC